MDIPDCTGHGLKKDLRKFYLGLKDPSKGSTQGLMQTHHLLIPLPQAGFRSLWIPVTSIRSLASEMFLKFILRVWVFGLHKHLCTVSEPGTQRGQKRASELLELEL